jgi:hypothetical protein
LRFAILLKKNKMQVIFKEKFMNIKNINKIFDYFVKDEDIIQLKTNNI